jgi:hypothetical protein
MTELTEEIKTLIVFNRHIELVRERLINLAHQLEERAQLHDLSKFQEDEFGGFVEINQVARQFPYGSAEYMESIKNNNAVALHYSRNSHHPEYHAGGVSDMGLLDLIEMVADWGAASEAYGQTSFEDALKKQTERFKLTPEQVHFIRIIAEVVS